MKFQIKNIGAIGYADIDIEGITIIAGENNVGKSTVGKALYAFLHEMSLWKKIYDDICSTRIEQFLYQNSIYLEDLCMKISGARRRRTSKADQLQKRYSRYEDVLVAIEDYQIAEGEKTKEQTRENMMEIFLRYCHDYISLYAKDNTEELWEKNEYEVYAWCEKALRGIDSLELDELKIQTQKIKGAFQEVFNSQYRKIGTSESEIVLIDDGGREVKLTVTDEREELNQPVRAANRIFFIESPKIYDYLSNTSYGHVQKEYLRHLMSPNIFKKGKPNIKIEENGYAGEQNGYYGELEKIERHLVTVMGGRAEFLQKVGLEFKDDLIDEPIHSVNVSTGLKSMALLEYALRIGAIEHGDILVLDEPEINLHPEWQVEYARALVNLQKTFHLKFLITTHSPYFMRAIECFTDVSDTMEQLNVYRVGRENGEVRMKNVSYSEFGMTDLYDELSMPLEELESLLDEKYGDEITEDDESIR